jgi:uncharacterized membrane protein
MSISPATPKATRRHAYAAATFAAVFTVVVALVRFPPASIWMDESWSAAAASLSVFDAVILTLRFDLHPPLYYAQMSLWGLLGQSDFWLYGNSVFWGALAVFSLTVAGARLYGWRVGLAAGLLLASLPLFAGTLHSLRMYAMLTTLAIWCWGAWHRALGPAPSVSWMGAAIVLQWCMAYSQGAGSVMAGFIGLYALALAWEQSGFSRNWRHVLYAQLLFAIGCLPALANSAIRSIDHTVAPGLAVIADTLGQLLIGMPAWPAALLFGVIAAAGIYNRQTRLLTLAFLLVPFAAAATISHAVKPIWQLRLFIFLVPFIALIVALLLNAAFSARPKAFAAALALIAGASLSQTLSLRTEATPPQDYRALAVRLQSVEAAGDYVYAPRFWDYWAVMRYRLGPDWGSPLAIQGTSTTPRWEQIYAALGPVWLRRLNLAPRGDRIVHDDVTYVIGPAQAQSFPAAARIWVVQPVHAAEPVPFAATHKPEQVITVQGLRLVLYTPLPQAMP